MPYSKKDFEDLLKSYYQHKSILEEPSTPMDYKINKFKRILKLLDHHDEYYTILNNDSLTLEWSYGVEKVLGYPQSEWDTYKSLSIIHDQYRDMYLNLGLLFYQLLSEENIPLVPFKHRYMINYPVQKLNGKYVWVKQMTMPLMLDINGRMVKQISSYTVVCRFQHGITLPTTPRIFDANGLRMKELEHLIFKKYFERFNLTLKPMHINILKGFLKIDHTKSESEKLKNIQNGVPPVTYTEVAAHINQPVSIIKKHSSEINKKMKAAFRRDFSNTYHIALFLKGMNYVNA